MLQGTTRNSQIARRVVYTRVSQYL